jgi:hypothetical protein
VGYKKSCADMNSPKTDIIATFSFGSVREFPYEAKSVCYPRDK